MSPLLARLTAALAGRYALDREIGEGGMATVFLATDVRHERPVAIKVLHPELSAMLGPERFLSEIKLTASLQHPHILPLFDSGVADGLLFYVMPFVEGETLRRRLDRERQLPVADAVRLATEISDALEYAHTRGIVHRDVKPENVLLQSGRAVVADFGIALAVQQAGGTRMTQTGLSLGTPQYMAPEQAMGERNIDARADIYALGAITYEMLAGEPPFSGPTAQAIVARVMTERARPLRTVRDTVPEPVATAVATALEKLPADRFASAALFGQALVASPGATAFRPAEPVAGTSASSSWRRSLPLVAVAACVGAVLSGGAIWRYRTPAAVEPPLPLHFEVTPPDSVALRVICCGHMFAISPNGRWLLFQGSQSTDSTAGRLGRDAHLYLRDLTDLRTQRLPATANASSMFFSPGSDEIGFVANQQLWRLSLGGNEPQLIATVPEGFVGGGHWSDDGNITLAVTGRMLQVAATGGTLTPLFAPDTTGMQLGGPQRWTREQVLLYTAGSYIQSPQIRWRSLATGASHVVAAGATPVYIPGQQALLFVRADGALMRYPFDLVKGDTTGPGVIVANRVVRRSPVLLHAEYAASSTGTLVMVKRRESSETRGLTFVNLQGAPVAPLGVSPLFSLFYSLDFSPSASHLLISAGGANSDIQPFVLDVQRRAVTRLPVDGRLNGVGWTQSGDSVLYGIGAKEIFVRPIDGSGTPTRILTLHDWSITGRLSAWGPWVVFDGQKGTDETRIGVAHRDSLGRVQTIGQLRAAEASPAISPDGKWLAFTSWENGREDVVITNFPTAAGRFLVSPDGGSRATWGRDSKTLYFEQGTRIMAASITPGEPGQPPAIGALRAIYRRDPWGYAGVSPDGRLLVFADRVREGEPASLTVRLQALSSDASSQRR